MKPLREQLIEDMKTSGKNVIPVGNSCIKLVEKKSRKTVGMKQMFTIIKEKLGTDAESVVRVACEQQRGDAVIKHSLKICDNDESPPATN